MERRTFKVEGLHCAEEVAILQDVVGGAPGVGKITCSVLQEKLVVDYDPSQIHASKILSLIAGTGMRGRLWREEGPKTDWQGLLSLGLSGFFFLLALIFGYPGFYILSIVSAIWRIVPKAVFSLKTIRPDMNLLMVIAICGALGIGQWIEGASVAFLFALALVLENWSVRRARRAIFSLLELSPTVAFVDGEEKRVEEIAVGAIILVRPGEKIPLDGRVYGGNSFVDQASITGESLPVHKQMGDEVFAGTLNTEGALEVQVTRPAEQTTLARMIQLVEEAREKRTPSEQWVEKFARIYTPVMVLASFSLMGVLALIGVPWQEAVYRGLVLLVIACPCALVISTPVSIVSGLTCAARAGVLIKGGVFLEILARIRALALDKTGTLTQGKPEIQAIVPLNDHTEEELLERAAALEAPSEHPLSRAVLAKAQQRGVAFEPARDYQAVRGKGAKALYRDRPFWIGSHRFMHEQGQETPLVHEKALALEDAGHTIIALGTDDHVCGLLSVADPPRSGVKESIQALKAAGIQEIVMLTGDNAPTAQALTRVTGVDRYLADLLPSEKVSAVEALKEQWGMVGMIGDGINDAPAMAASSCGIAMAGMGTDAAIETADVALMGDDLSKVPWLISHARRTLRMIKQNITFSLGVKALFVVLALMDLASLWMAIAADTGATLLVTANALRLLRR